MGHQKHWTYKLLSRSSLILLAIPFSNLPWSCYIHYFLFDHFDSTNLYFWIISFPFTETDYWKVIPYIRIHCKRCSGWLYHGNIFGLTIERNALGYFTYPPLSITQKSITWYSIAEKKANNNTLYQADRQHQNI